MPAMPVIPIDSVTPVLAQVDVMEWFRSGGWVMWPLLALSVTSVALTIERAVFWWRAHGGGRAGRATAISAEAAAGRLDAARAAARADRGVYGAFAIELLDRVESTRDAEAVNAIAHDLAEQARGSIERFGATLTTIITAAPMLGILGTVSGIIRSFRLLDADQAAVDPSLVAGGISEALITTAFGLMIAIVTLFPYAVFRAHADRCLGRLVAISAAVGAAVAQRSREASPKRSGAESGKGSDAA